MNHPKDLPQSEAELLNELANLMEASTEDSFDIERLDALLDALDQVSPLPPGTIQSPQESLKIFHKRIKK